MSISTLAHEYRPGHRVHEHSHGSDQLVYAVAGVMEISAGGGLWLIPPQFAVWIPARTIHSIRMPGAVAMRTLYVRCGLASGLPPICTVLHVAPLLRELILEAVRMKALRSRERLDNALCELLLSHLGVASPVPISVTVPKDPRARVIADMIIENPAQRRSMASMCAKSGATVRTIQRLFRREVGSDFESWRRQVRLMKAIELLVSGNSVKAVSFSLGYRQPSAFVQMFRGIMGVTPGSWIQSMNRSNK